MKEKVTTVPVRGGRMRIPRSRGAASGFLLILLGAWGALIPFAGPAFGFAYTPDQEWAWTAARGWLEVLPGAVTAVGGVFLFTSGNRATAMLGGWLTVVAGAWFVVGRTFAGPLGLGDAGAPVAGNDTKRLLLELTYFSGLGAVIVFLGALALGRLSVRSLRDIQYAHRPAAATESTDSITESTESIDAAPPRHALPETAASEATAAEATGAGTTGSKADLQEGASRDTEEARHHGFAGLFRGRRETTTSAR